MKSTEFGLLIALGTVAAIGLAPHAHAATFMCKFTYHDEQSMHGYDGPYDGDSADAVKAQIRSNVEAAKDRLDSVECSPLNDKDATYHLLTKAENGQVSLLSGLTEAQCAKAKDKVEMHFGDCNGCSFSIPRNAIMSNNATCFK